MYLTKKDKQISAEDIFLILITVGYVIICSLAIPFDVENPRVFSVPFRFFVFVFSFWIIYRNFSLPKIKNIAVASFSLFWLVYLIKMLISFNSDFYEPQIVQSRNEILIRILVIAFMPSLALMMMDYRKVNFPLITRIFFGVLFTLLVVNMVYKFTNTTPAGSFANIFSIYYISAGHLGTSLFIVSLFYMLFLRVKTLTWLWVLGMSLGMVSIVFITARSPILALFVVTLFLLLVKRKWEYILIYFLILFLSLALIYILCKENFEGNDFVNRTYKWIYEGDNSLRTPLFNQSIDIIKAHTLFGNRILYKDGSYPHNIFLELLMSTGVIGLILYFVKFVPVLINFKLFINEKLNGYFILFFALFLQYFVLVLTSYNLFSVPEFLHFSSVVIGIGLNKYYEKT